MNTFKKPYEISVWEDVLENGILKERKILTIGSNRMKNPGRVLEPQLTTNTNGTKKLVFKMYKKYIDPKTGKEVENIFSNYLFNERKIKLFYKSKWYDFIIKNIEETSTNFLYTYSLEDALVNELSKNGFGVVLDPELGQSSIGTSQQLAEYVLQESNWKVSENTEVAVQTIEEPLIYLEVNSIEQQSLIATHLLDSRNNKTGVTHDSNLLFLNKGDVLLGFYSCCTDKPYRFQFIYLPNGYAPEKVSKDQWRIIKERDCQYFLELAPDEYVQQEEDFLNHFYLPKGISIKLDIEKEIKDETYISSLYKGNRYGFSPQSEYIPQFKTFVQKFKKTGSDEDFYELIKAQYISPYTLENLITNADCNDKAGWKINGSGELDLVLGYFENDKFNGIESFEDYDSKYDIIRPYIRIKDAEANTKIINSGPRDHRSAINDMPLGSNYICDITLLDETGEPSSKSIEYALEEYENIGGFLTKLDGFKTDTVVFESKDDSGHHERGVQVIETQYNEDSFKNSSKVHFVVTVKLEEGEKYTCYISHAELYRYARNKEGNLITIDTIEKGHENGAMLHEYCYFSKDNIVNSQSISEVKYDSVLSAPDYQIYYPVYNEQAESIRSIKIQESNYFNILQNIAETFNQWLDFEIVRDEFGGIVEKKVLFKNYITQDNFFGFKYGVNLQGIQRNVQSNQIVNKLIVKHNNNEFGTDGYCTISRAKANPTGEDYIYDFSYYFSKGLLDEQDFLKTVYDSSDQCGPDIDINQSETDFNLKGYYNRIKVLNSKYAQKSEELIHLSLDLTKIQADLYVNQARRDAATSELEEYQDTYPELFSTSKYNKVIRADIKGKEISFRNFAGSPSTLKSTIKPNSNNTYIVQVTPENSWKDFKFLAEYKDEKGDNIVHQISIGSVVAGHVYECQITFIPKSEKELDDETKAALQKHVISLSQQKNADNNITRLNDKITKIENQRKELTDEMLILMGWKKQLNLLFQQKYGSFIQEGTWLSEEYIDDEKYYIDALSVVYNSCHPQVSYNINVLQFNDLPDFSIGDKTFIEDPGFFGYNSDNEPIRTEIIVTEKIEHLENPKKDQIKVQNFKNEFQDLFQKITATVQQAQYNNGAYQKGLSIVTGSSSKKEEFVLQALKEAEGMLEVGGQHSVAMDHSGISIINGNNVAQQIRLIGGAILISDEDGKWRTAMTGNGISASALSSGIINTENIAIMTGRDTHFKWNGLGLNALNYEYGENDSPVSGAFIRFDKYGIYGIKTNLLAEAEEANKSFDITSWKPNNIEEINEKATFSLTWDGLKVAGNEGVVAHIGKTKENIINITKSDGQKTIFSVDNNGNVVIGGDATTLNINGGEINGTVIKAHTIQVGNPEKPGFYVDDKGNVKYSGTVEWGAEVGPVYAIYNSNQDGKIPEGIPEGTDYSNIPEDRKDIYNGWHKKFDSQDLYAQYSYDGGNTWSEIIAIVGRGIETIELDRFEDEIIPMVVTYAIDNELIPTKTMAPRKLRVYKVKYNDGTSSEFSVADGSDAEVTYDNWWDALNNAVGEDPDRGLYILPDEDGSKKVAINADLIQTGAIKIAIPPKEENGEEQRVFYADILNKEVELAGWHASTGALWYGGEQNAPELYLGTQGITGMVNKQDINNLLFKVKENFGVDNEGKLYCSNAQLSGTITGSSFVISNSFTKTRRYTFVKTENSPSGTIFLPNLTNIDSIILTLDDDYPGYLFNSATLVNEEGTVKTVLAEGNKKKIVINCTDSSTKKAGKIAVLFDKNPPEDPSQFEPTINVSISYKLDNCELDEKGYNGIIVMENLPYYGDARKPVYVDELGRLCC